jgi:flagellar hook-length control protein FliK
VGQVAHAVAAVHVAAGAQGQVTIHLQPGDLGIVQVKIERAADGTATVTVQVEKPATLQAMQQDISHLHQALDRAGVPAEQRQVTLHLTPPGVSAGFAESGPGGGGGFQRGGQKQGQARAVVEDDPEEAPRWVAAGVNITA